MHDEKNQKESAVITVASKRNSKEGRKTMENKSLNINDESSKKRTKLTVHEVAKGMQGITLIALVVTIIQKEKQCHQLRVEINLKTQKQ